MTSCALRQKIFRITVPVFLICAIAFGCGNALAENFPVRKMAQSNANQVDAGLKLLEKNNDESFRQAYLLFKDAAAKNNPDAEYNLGVLYLNGQGVQANEAEAAKWFRKASVHGHMVAQFNLAQYELDLGNYREAVRWFKNAADRGNIIAANNLGTLYFDGKGVEKSDLMAFKYFEIAAKRNYASAQHNLGKMYLNGWGAKQDLEKAKELFIAAMELGDLNATTALAAMYRSGTGIQTDLKRAAVLYEQAAKRGNPHAQFMIGLMYGKGQGVKKNNNAMCYWLEQAAIGGEVVAQDAKLKLCMNFIQSGEK